MGSAHQHGGVRGLHAVCTGNLDGGLSLFTMAMMTFAINIRHSFYGLSFIQKFKEMGKRRLYMIFSLTDETYSLLCSAKTPKGWMKSSTIWPSP